MISTEIVCDLNTTIGRAIRVIGTISMFVWIVHCCWTLVLGLCKTGVVGFHFDRDRNNCLDIAQNREFAWFESGCLPTKRNKGNGTV